MQTILLFDEVDRIRNKAACSTHGPAERRAL